MKKILALILISISSFLLSGVQTAFAQSGTVITVLLYNNKGYKKGLIKYTNLNNGDASVFWQQWDTTYVSDGTAAEFSESIHDALDCENAGIVCDLNGEYAWFFNTDTTGGNFILYGPYLYALRQTQVNLVGLENFIHDLVQSACDDYGTVEVNGTTKPRFYIISDIRKLPLQFQKISIGKNGP